MTEHEFTALIDLIRAHVVHAHMTTGRQYDRPFMDARQLELEEKIDEARDALVTSLRPSEPLETSRGMPRSDHPGHSR